MEVKKIDDTQITNAIDLIWQTFLQFEAPDYSEEGVKSFQDFIEGNTAQKSRRDTARSDIIRPWINR